MVRIETVLCPVDFSKQSDRELEIAVETCETFGARLVLHHNLAFAAPGWSKAWEWEETHPLGKDEEAQANARMEALLARIPGSVRAEATISRGLVIPVLLHLVETLPAQLLILGSHGWSTDDHASVADRILETFPCPVLTIREGGDESQPFRLRPVEGDDVPRVLVPTDFSAAGDEAAKYAFELARFLPMRLHLLHVLPSSWREGGQRMPPSLAAKAGEAQARLEAMVPEDVRGRVECVVKAGPVTGVMMSVTLHQEPKLIVMGRHASGLIKHFFTHDHAKDMLHRASCPVWFAA